MDVAKLLDPVATTKRRLADRIQESSAHFPLMRRKRRVVALWLLTAHGAQIVLLALFLFLQIGFPRVRDAALDRAIPESVSGKLAGLFGSESRADRRRHVAAQAATVFAWTGGGSIALLMFWIRIPAAITRSAAIARERELEADALLGSTPSRSVMLYKSALALACDAEYQLALEHKLQRIDEQLSRATDEAAPQRSHDDDTNTVAGRYTITDELGRGANGVVYRAKDEVLGREVALKELPAQRSHDEFVAPRFRQEARALARLNHPNIVQVYDFIEHQKRMWIAIELVEGGNLASYLAQQGFLTAPEACRIGAQIAEAVAFAHERGVVHRDLKPLNVLLADEETPKVTDFGLAKLAEGGVDTLEGTVMGSPHYMSPEQAEGGSISHSTDIYSLGVILYQMLTGQVPFEGEIASVLAQHIRKPPRRLRDVAPNRNIPPKLEKLVMAMLAKSVEKRPPEMREVTATLARYSRRRAHA
jgi:tRNA A-37 threonylcarbamoyl transferase component Bud32